MTHLIFCVIPCVIFCFELIEMCRESINIEDLDRKEDVYRLLAINKALSSDLFQESASIGRSTILSSTKKNERIDIEYYLPTHKDYNSDFLLKYYIMKNSKVTFTNEIDGEQIIEEYDKKKIFNQIHQKLLVNSDNMKFFYCQLNEKESGERTIEKYKLEPIIYYVIEILNNINVLPFDKFIDEFKRYPKNLNLKKEIEKCNHTKFIYCMDVLIFYLKKNDRLFNKIKSNEINTTKAIWKGSFNRNQRYTIKITLLDQSIYYFQKKASENGYIMLTRQDFIDLIGKKETFHEVLILLKNNHKRTKFNVTNMVNEL